MSGLLQFHSSKNCSLDRAGELLANGRATEALPILDVSLQQAPRDVSLLLYSGLANVDAGNTDAGIRQLEQAAKLDQNNAILHFFLARARYDVGDCPGALKECALVESAQAGHPGSAALRALCLAHDDPIAGLSTLALCGLPDDSEILGRALLVAELALKKEETPAKAATWTGSRMPWQIVARTSGGPSGRKREVNSPGHLSKRQWMRKSRFMQANGSLERAIVFAEAAMREKQEDDTRVLLATLYFDAGRYAETEAALRGFLPDDPERNSYVGMSLFHLGDFRAAVGALEKGDPTMGRGLHTLGRVHLILDNFLKARQCLVRTAQVDESIATSRIAHAYLVCRR